MADDDVYAYEQEMEDEWETMHAHEMEAADEEMRAMEAAEAAIVAKQSNPASQPVSAAPAQVHQHGGANMAEQEEGDAETSAIDAKIARAQDRLNQVLERCATLMGEDGDMEDMELVEDAAARKQKATAVDATTSSFLHSRPPIDVDSLPIVLSGGQRMFLRKKSRSVEGGNGADSSATSSLSLVPIKEMMEAIERVRVPCFLSHVLLVSMCSPCRFAQLVSSCTAANRNDNGKRRACRIVRRAFLCADRRCSTARECALAGQVQTKALHRPVE